MTMFTLAIFIAVFVGVLVVALVGLVIYWAAQEEKQGAEERIRRQKFYRAIYTSDVTKE